MAHYAFLDESNIVTEVISGVDETELIEGLDTETWYANFRGQTCKRTSYNGNIRKNYAFIAPKPDNATGFDENTCKWIVPNEALAQ